MRVLVAHNAYKQPGGEDEVFRNEVSLMRNSGFEVAEYLEHNNDIDDMKRATLVADTVWSRRTKRKLKEVLQEFCPDIVHFHNTFPLISPSAYAACQENGIPVVQTLHNYRLLCPAANLFRSGQVCQDCLHRRLKWPAILHHCYRDSYLASSTVSAMLAVHSVLRTWERRITKFIALTEFSRAQLMEGGLPGEKIIVKPNFVSLNPLSKSTSSGNVVFIGRLVPEKGLTVLLEAWKRLVDPIPLQIIGDGPIRTLVETKIRELNLARVELAGHLPKDDVINKMLGARFLVFPSIWFEGFPMTLVEAFACRLPVIASRLGSMEEIVRDGETGLHFEPGNPIDLAQKISWAWSHPAEMTEMGSAAHREYESKYTPERNLELLTSLYKGAMKVSLSSK